MSLLLAPVFEPNVDTATDYTGEILGSCIDGLERLTQRRRLTPLSAFMDPRPVPEDYDGPPWELDDDLNESVGPWNDWFPCSDGIEVVEAILTLLSAEPELIGRFGLSESLIPELEALRTELEAGHRAEAQFRLQFDGW